jgi:hypothetical protein
LVLTLAKKSKEEQEAPLVREISRTLLRLVKELSEAKSIGVPSM